VCRTRGCVLFTRIVTRHLLMVTRGCARFPCASSHVTRVLFRTWWRAGWRVIRVRRAHCFVYRQRAMSRVSVRRLHTVVMFHVLRVSSRSANSSCLESLMLFNLLI
jgi:hypothetical protein